jgi:uncharacterized membrane protein
MHGVLASRHMSDRNSGIPRLEAFSDGVFAIAITLLILEVKIPHLQDVGPNSLAQQLLQLWPSYGAYILSFVMIGIYWANHHYICRYFVRSDHAFNLLHVLFLMCVAFIPFPTAILGQYVTHPESQRTAVAFYALGMLLPAFTWLLIWLYASCGHRLLEPTLDSRFVHRLTRQFIVSNVLYAGALAVACWLPLVSLAICVGLTLLYLLPPPRPAR